MEKQIIVEVISTYKIFENKKQQTKDKYKYKQSK